MDDSGSNSPFSVVKALLDPPRKLKKRSARWEDLEERFLIEAVLEKESILFCDLKGPGSKTSIGQRRTETWANIARRLSAKFANVERTGDEVKKKYFNLKQRAKEKIIKERRSRDQIWSLPQTASLKPAEEILLKSLETRPLAQPGDTDDEDSQAKNTSSDAKLTENRTSFPGTEMCFTSKAVNTILNTNDPLDIPQTWPTPETSADPEANSSGYPESIVKIEKPDEVEEYPTKYRPILPNTLRQVILKRVSDVEPPTESHETPASLSSPRKRARTEHAPLVKAQLANAHVVNAPISNGIDSDELHNGVDEFEDGADDSANSTFPPFYNAEYETDNFMKLNKEVLELKKKKLVTKIEKLMLERESAEYDRDRAKVEKETAVLIQEKVKLELDVLKKSFST